MRVVAIDPGGQRFGFAVLEGRDQLIDWGLRKFPGGRTARGMRRVVEVVDLYDPDVIVIEDVSSKHAGRSPRTRRLVKAVVELGARLGIPTHSFSRSGIRATFLQSGAFSKEEISAVIVKRFPILALRLPPIRKPWMHEDHRVNIFEATALALTFFDREGKGGGAAEG